MVEIAPIVSKVTERTLSARVNIPQAMQWIETHPEEFGTQIQAFDEVVASFNNSEAPVDNRNQRLLKQTLTKPLLTISGMFKQGGREGLKAFIRTMRTVNEQMIRGETTKEEPYLGFHTTVANDNQAVIAGAIFHVYEEFLLADHEYGGFERGTLVDALVETLASNKENPLYDPIANKERLNWIDGWEGFSLEFRQSHGFT